MYRVDNSTATTTLPTPAAVGPNPNSFFTDGDPASGVAATVVDDDWLNMVQETLCQAITSDGTALSKTDYTQLKAKLAGRLINVQVITTSGTYTPTPGATSAEILLIGGGGGGGGVPAISSGSAAGIGAGGGGASGALQWIGPAANLSGAVVTIGAGGAGGVASGFTGSPGGTSSFILGTTISLTSNGGSGGPTQGASTQTVGTPGGAGGGSGASSLNGGTLIFNSTGEAGGIGFWFATTGGSLISGCGASSYLGGGGGPVAGAVGRAATSHGAGGSGASGSGTSSPAFNGGAGAGGICIIEEYS